MCQPSLELCIILPVPSHSPSSPAPPCAALGAFPSGRELLIFAVPSLLIPPFRILWRDPFLCRRERSHFVLVFPAYKDLQTREDIRNAAWHKPGWDELVYYTGNPLTSLECWGQTLSCATLSAPQHIPLGEKVLYLMGKCVPVPVFNL